MKDAAALLREYVAHGSEEAFGELVRRHIDLVYRAALRQLHGHVHQAEDVTQQVFADLARKAGSLSRHPNLAGWLYLATRHTATALMRSEQRRQAREQEAWAMNEPTGDSDDRTQLRPLLDGALQHLKPRDREVILLRFYEQRPFGEVGAILRLTEDAARRRTDRALDRLREVLGRRGVTSSAVAIAALFGSETAIAAPAGLAAVVVQGSAALAGGGTASGLIAFMTTNKAMVGLGALLALAMGGAVHESKTLQSAQTELLVAVRAQEAMARRFQAAKEDLRIAGSGGVAAAASAKPVAHSARAVAPIRALGARASNRWPALGPKLAADPDLQRAYIDNQLLQQGLVYGPSLRAAGLPPDKTERFMEFVHESLWNQMDIKLAGESLGLQPDDPAVSSLTMESRLNFQAQAAQEFPPGEFARFQGGVEELFELGPFAGSLYDTGDPLTLGQADKLTQMIAQANPETLNDWTGVVQQAPAILAPSQLSAFQALTDQLKFQIAVNRAYAAAAKAAHP